MLQSDGEIYIGLILVMYERNYEQIPMKSVNFMQFNPHFFITPLIHCAQINDISHIIGM